MGLEGGAEASSKTGRADGSWCALRQAHTRRRCWGDKLQQVGCGAHAAALLAMPAVQQTDTLDPRTCMCDVQHVAKGKVLCARSTDRANQARVYLT